MFFLKHLKGVNVAVIIIMAMVAPGYHSMSYHHPAGAGSYTGPKRVQMDAIQEMEKMILLSGLTA